MSRKKTIIVAIVLALVLLIGGLIAYFTDTDTAINQFTLGDEVEISITETGWTKTTGTTNWTNSSALGVHPGVTVAKDPKISNDSETTPAYVFAEVIVPCYASTGTTADTPLYTLNDSSDPAVPLGTTVGSSGNTGWTLISVSSVNTTDKTITYVYAWGTSSEMTPLAASTPTTTPVFSSVTVAPTLTAAQKATASATPNIVVNAYGIQTDGLSVTAPTAIYALAHPTN